MFGPDYFGSHDFLERLRGGICGWQDHRARRRAAQTHHAAPVSGPPPATMHSGSAPAAGPPSAGSPVLVCFHAVRGRLVPVFGDPAEFAATAGQADETHQAPPPATAPPSPASQAAPSSAPRPAPASTGPQEHTAQGTRTPPTTVEPPDFSVQAVQASASSRGAQPVRPPSSERPGPATVLNLSPPTPPSLVRTDEQAVTVERVLAQHRTEMEASEARQVAALRDVLAEHRQSLADLLAQHREALREQAVMPTHPGTDDAQPFAQLRELLTEQARVMQDEHGRNADANADLAGMIAGLGETVNRLAVAVAERRAPSFGPPPRRTQEPGQEAAPVTAPTPSSTPAVPATQSAPPDAPPHPEPEQRDSAAARPLTVVRSAPTPPVPARSPTRAAPLTASASSSSTTSRACVSSVTASLASVFAAAPTATASASITPHQRRIAEEARQREHVHASIADDDDDDNATLEAPHG